MKSRETKIRIYTTLGTLLSLVLLLVFLFWGENFELLKSLFTDDLSREELQQRLSDFGFRGYVTLAVLNMVQLVCTFLPSQPVQILSGITYGFYAGVVCCVIGVFLGATAVYLLQKSFGHKLRHLFGKTLHLDVGAIARSNKSSVIVILLYLVPVIPYGVLCFFSASMGMRYRRYILVNMIGAIPTICLGVGLGYMTITASLELIVCVLVVLIALAILLFCSRKWLLSRITAMAKPYSSKTKVRKGNPVMLYLFYFGARVGYFFAGIHIKSTNRLKKKVKGPAIVLCNHGSFIDFLYAETLLLKSQPHFVAARLYFYHKMLGGLMRRLGVFPKSMFALDVESVKNSMKVLQEGRVLAMMPEARLSTAGRFEDIQPSTYSFLKKCQVDVYTVKISGDYLANPKWGKGLRRGARVEAELDVLLTVDQLQSMTEAEIKQAVEDRLYYDEFAWLEQHPDYRYTAKNLAEGLENILTICPKCHGRHTIRTEGREVSCEHCGKLTELNDRYGFAEDFTFQNFGQWYDWQKEELKKEILADPDYVLSSPVELRLPSKDGKTLTRPGGEGVCTLSRNGLTYKGTRDGEAYEISFTLSKIYRLLFGAGENFEVYNGSEILYFVPAERRSAVDWYMASAILHDET